MIRLLLTGLLCIALSAPAIANEGTGNSGAPDIASFANMPDDQFNLYAGLSAVSKDIAQKAFNYDLNAEKFQGLMKDQVSEIKSMIPSDDPEAKLNAISQYLFDIKKIEIAPIDKQPIKPESVLVPFILDTKQGLEFAVALLYAAIAQELGLPLEGIQKSDTLQLVYSDGSKKFVIDVGDKGKVLASGFASYEKLDRAKDENARLSAKNMLGFFMVKATALLGAKKQTHEALKYLEYAEKLFPEDAGIYLEKGTIYKMLDNPVEAEKAWKKALEINPQSETGYARLSIHYIATKQFEEVEKLMAKLDEIDPKGNQHAILSMNYTVQNMHDKAAQHFEIEKERNPDKENSYKNLGLSYMELKEYGKALAIYDEAIAKFPEDTDFYALKAKVYHASNNIDGLIAASKEALQKDPNQPAMYAFLAIGYHEKGMAEKAEETIEETVDKYKDDWRAAGIYADYLMDVKKDHKTARKYYKISFKRNPSRPQPLYQLGLTYYYEKKPMSAQLEFEKGLKQFEGKQQALFHLGLALTDAYRTKFDNAIEHYKIAKENGFENKGLEERFLRYQQTGK